MAARLADLIADWRDKGYTRTDELDAVLLRSGDLYRVRGGRGRMLDMLTIVSVAAIAPTAGDPPEPWYESQLIGVIAGALVAGLVSWLLAAHTARAADRQAAERRAFDRVELRRESRKAASQAFLAAVRKEFDFSKGHEEEYHMRIGDMHPEEYRRAPQVENALADLALEVPDDVYAAAVRLRDVLDIHVWGWDATTRTDADATDRDVEAAEASFRRAVRDLLAND